MKRTHTIRTVTYVDEEYEGYEVSRSRDSGTHAGITVNVVGSRKLEFYGHEYEQRARALARLLAAAADDPCKLPEDQP